MVAIEVTETFEVARVEVGDDYRVHLWQARKASSYTPTQALQLSQELAEAALAARRAVEERLEADRARTLETAAGGFDGGSSDGFALPPESAMPEWMRHLRYRPAVGTSRDGTGV